MSNENRRILSEFMRMMCNIVIEQVQEIESLENELSENRDIIDAAREKASEQHEQSV